MKKTMKIVATVIALVVATVGCMKYGITSKAEEINNVEGEQIENINDEYIKVVNEIKEKYNIEETIVNISDLKEKLLNMDTRNKEDYEKIIAETDENIIYEFVLEETKEHLKSMNDLINDVNEVVNNRNSVDSDEIECKVYENGNFEVRKSVINEYGSETACRISDKQVQNTREFNKVDGFVGENKSFKYKGTQERICNFTWEDTIIFNFKINISFDMRYSASDDGLKSLSIEDNGTKTTYPFSSLSYTRKNMNDTVAKSIPSNIDGTVICKMAFLPGFSYKGVPVTSAGSFNIKINFWLTLNAWDKTSKSMTVRPAYSVYMDDFAFLS